MSRYMAAVHLEEISGPIFDAFFDSAFLSVPTGFRQPALSRWHLWLLF